MDSYPLERIETTRSKSSLGPDYRPPSPAPSDEASPRTKLGDIDPAGIEGYVIPVPKIDPFNFQSAFLSEEALLGLRKRGKGGKDVEKYQKDQNEVCT